MNLEISIPTQERIGRLQTLTGARSMVEVVSWALATYEKLVALEAEGNEVLIRNLKSSKESGLILTPK